MAKTFKIALGGGHGGAGSTPGKRTPDGEYEWDFNDAVVDGFMEEIETNYTGVELMRTDDSDGLTDVPLATRTKMANNWKADIYISFHQNALAGKWGNHGGTETFYYQGSPESKKLAEVVHKAMLDTLKLRDRGLKAGNHLWIVRQTTMPAVLSEGGFMDSLTDIKVLRNRPLLEQAGRNVAKAVATAYGLKRKSGSTVTAPKPTTSKPSTGGLYRVRKTWADVKSQKGAFSNLENAKELADKYSGYEVYNEAGQVVYPVAKPTPTQPSYIGKRVEAKVDVRFYSRPSWSDKDVVGTCKAGLGFTIIDKVAIGGAYQYKVKNSKGNIYYITASTKYVKVV